jgi:hypothetical protein
MESHSRIRQLTALSFGVLALWLCLALTAGTARAYDLMLDRSGSMAGFKDAGRNGAGPDLWLELIGGLEAGAERRFPFGNDLYDPLPRGESLGSLPLKDNRTEIGLALEKWMVNRANSGDTLLLLTDNVVDSDQSRDDKVNDQERFNRALRSPESGVSHLAVIVLRLPFNGRIYPLEGEGFKMLRDKPRALVLYVISRGDAAEFDLALSTVRALMTRLDVDHQVLLVRPFDTSSLRSKSTSSSAIEVPPELRTKLALKDGVIWMRNLSFGDQVDFPLNIEVRSDSPFVLKQVRADVDVDFDSSDTLVRSGDFDVSIDPPVVDIPPEETQRFTIRVAGTRFALPQQTNLIDHAMLTLSDAEPIRGSLTARLKATMSNIDLSAGVLERWSHADVAGLGDPDAAGVHERVYKLKPLVMELIPRAQDEEILLLDKTLGINIDMRYPMAPLLGLLLLGLLALGLLILLFRWLTRRREFVLTDDFGDPRPFAPGLLQRRAIHGGQGAPSGVVFYLTYLFFGFLVRPGPGFRVEGSALISGQRDAIRVSRKDADDFDVQTWDLRAVRGKDPAGPGAAGDLWGNEWNK